MSLSEQNLIDCSHSYGNKGCQGGSIQRAFQYIKHNKGIDSEQSYKYEGRDDTCRFNISTVGATDTGFIRVKTGSEEALKLAVATVGPISVAIDSSRESFQMYTAGVYNGGRICSTTYLDHSVLVGKTLIIIFDLFEDYKTFPQIFQSDTEEMTILERTIGS